jgi:hypothetical protein
VLIDACSFGRYEALAYDDVTETALEVSSHPFVGEIASRRCTETRTATIMTVITTTTTTTKQPNVSWLQLFGQQAPNESHMHECGSANSICRFKNLSTGVWLLLTTVRGLQLLQGNDDAASSIGLQSPCKFNNIKANGLAVTYTAFDQQQYY